MGGSYGVIHDDIFDSSLAVDHHARWVFQDMIILADANDNVMMDPTRLALRTRAPIEIIRGALKVLCEPDPASKSDLESGKRLTEILNGQGSVIGYHVVNRHYYKRLMTRARRRAYMREYRRKKLSDAFEQRAKTSNGGS